MLQDGFILGSYVIDGYVASGGMGVVYRAQHRVLRRTVALKVLLDTYARNPKVRQRFEQEAMLQANLEHPNIVRVSDFVTTDTHVALVMDFVAGPSLDQVLEEEQPGPWSEADWLPMFTRVVSAVAYAHAAGVVHRDIKPGNVLLDRANGRPGVPRIADFGIAKIVSGSTPAATRAGSRMGTVPYMAPEQFRGDLDVGPTADVYALGMLAWRLASGALPVNPDDMFAAVELYSGRQRVPSFGDVAPGLLPAQVRVLDVCLSLAPAARPADAGVLLKALGKPTVTPPTVVAPTVTAPTVTAAGAEGRSGWRWAAVALLVLIATALGAWKYWDRDRSGWAGPRASGNALAPASPTPAAAPPFETTPAVPASVAPGTPPSVVATAAGLDQLPEPAPLAVTDEEPYAPTSRLPTDYTAYARIEPGTFRMGTPKGEKGRSKDEVSHTVTITRPFYLKRTEVTQTEWRTLMGNNPSKHTGCDDCPVEQVSWYEAVAFVNALSRQEGLKPCYGRNCTGVPGTDSYRCEAVDFVGLSCEGYRLPTEAEWEYAARASTTGASYAALDSIAWYSRNSGGETHPAGRNLANAFGLSDMIGNVWEWCHDGYDAYGSGVVSDPTGEDGAVYRVSRGGSWIDSARDTRAGFRYWYGPADRFIYLGFRPARSIP